MQGYENTFHVSCLKILGYNLCRESLQKVRTLIWNPQPELHIKRLNSETSLTNINV